MTRLHTRTLGDQGPRIAFCHGLFGQGRNWTQVAKTMAVDHRATMIDLPDHGRSPWSETFSYVAMADAVADELRAIGGSDRWTLVGHSMGGKTVMLLALRHPELVERLVVVDMSPVSYGGLTSFGQFVDGMRAVPTDRITRREEAEEALRPAVPDATVRSFLLQNLRRDGDDFSWQMNLDLLGDALPLLGDWPAEEISAGATYGGPVLWVAGAESDYVKDEYADAMRALFPATRQVTVKKAGHWVHSEQPEIFTAILQRFLAAPGGDDRG